VRVVYSLKGADDFTISDLNALDRLRAAGCQVPYSNRLHAKDHATEHRGQFSVPRLESLRVQA
jgi:hypothetical protein